VFSVHSWYCSTAGMLGRHRPEAVLTLAKCILHFQVLSIEAVSLGLQSCC